MSIIHKVTRISVILGLSTVIAACSTLNIRTADQGPQQANTNQNIIVAKEKLYTATGNYAALVDLYRDMLKAKDDPMTRFKLANAYYYTGDYNASMMYLKPLLTLKSNLKSTAYLLQAKDLVQLGHYDDAVVMLERFIHNYPKVPEAYNQLGIAYAQLGNAKLANENILKARQLLLDDTVIVNNLAMLKIIQGDYRSAVELLLPQYLSGNKNSRMMHNLVFALIKNGQMQYAKDIIQKEKLSTDPDSLAVALNNVKELPKVKAKPIAR